MRTKGLATLILGIMIEDGKAAFGWKHKQHLSNDKSKNKMVDAFVRDEVDGTKCMYYFTCAYRSPNFHNNP